MRSENIIIKVNYPRISRITETTPLPAIKTLTRGRAYTSSSTPKLSINKVNYKTYKMRTKNYKN